MEQKYPIVRILYLYLFSLVGLIMLTIGSVQLVDLALKTYLFPGSDIYDAYYGRPLMPVKEGTETIAEKDFVEAMKTCQESCEITDEQQTALALWLEDYNTYEQEQGEFPEKNARRERQRQASRALASIIIGAPLFLFHWRVIQKDHTTKNS